ncbi:MAG: hypothetical protein RIT41_312 [Bacteroidota bacterium]
MREVMALSCARYNKYTLPSFTSAVGFKTFFASHCTVSFCKGQKKILLVSGTKMGLTISTL